MKYSSLFKAAGLAFALASFACGGIEDEGDDEQPIDTTEDHVAACDNGDIDWRCSRNGSSDPNHAFTIKKYQCRNSRWVKIDQYTDSGC